MDYIITHNNSSNRWEILVPTEYRIAPKYDAIYKVLTTFKTREDARDYIEHLKLIASTL